MIEFQSAHPVRGATITPSMFTLVSAYFNPRAPCGARQTRIEFASDNIKFQSTRPVWGATTSAGSQSVRGLISIHAPRVGRDAYKLRKWFDMAISIHAPRVGRDRVASMERRGRNYFNPRAPCGARRIHNGRKRLWWRFQSTRPVWGATLTNPSTLSSIIFQSTRPVWGATRRCSCEKLTRTYFNPRAPCGARPKVRTVRKGQEAFQSTRPVWGATTNAFALLVTFAISIHAPRVGRDGAIDELAFQAQQFQSTRPVWGATSPRCCS